jgi:hypothetical protein
LREGQRAQKEGVDDGEDDKIRTDAEREDEHRDESEGVVAAKGAHGEAEVLQEDVEPGKAASGALGFARLLDVTKAEEGRTAGFPRGEAAGDVLFDGEFQVKRQLGLEVGILLRLAEEGENTSEGLAERGH